MAIIGYDNASHHHDHTGISKHAKSDSHANLYKTASCSAPMNKITFIKLVVAKLLGIATTRFIKFDWLEDPQTPSCS